MLTKIKDLNFKILNELDDKSLVNFCETNTEARNLCNNQEFWQIRTIDKYGKILDIETMKKFKGNKTWSDYYIDLRENLTYKYPRYKAAKAKENNRTDLEILFKALKGIEIEFHSDKDAEENIEYYTDKHSKAFIPEMYGSFKVYKKGKLIEEANLMHTERIGTRKEYFVDSSKINIIQNYKLVNNRGVMDGDQYKFDENGNVVIYEYWEDGILKNRKFDPITYPNYEKYL